MTFLCFVFYFLPFLLLIFKFDLSLLISFAFQLTISSKPVRFLDQKMIVGQPASQPANNNRWNRISLAFDRRMDCWIISWSIRWVVWPSWGRISPVKRREWWTWRFDNESAPPPPPPPPPSSSLSHLPALIAKRGPLLGYLGLTCKNKKNQPDVPVCCWWRPTDWIVIIRHPRIWSIIIKVEHSLYCWSAFSSSSSSSSSG